MSEELAQNEGVAEYIRQLIWGAVENSLENVKQLEQKPEPAIPQVERPQLEVEMPLQCDPEHMALEEFYPEAKIPSLINQWGPDIKKDIDNLSKVINLNGKPINILRVIDLKNELAKHNLPKHGKQQHLIYRLTNYLRQNPHKCDPKGTNRGPDMAGGGSSAPIAATIQQGQVICLKQFPGYLV